jgi:hypothetical protein
VLQTSKLYWVMGQTMSQESLEVKAACITKSLATMYQVTAHKDCKFFIVYSLAIPAK